MQNGLEALDPMWRQFNGPSDGVNGSSKDSLESVPGPIALHELFERDRVIQIHPKAETLSQCDGTAHGGCWQGIRYFLGLC
jgi:hypothetical protein